MTVACCGYAGAAAAGPTVWLYRHSALANHRRFLWQEGPCREESGQNRHQPEEAAEGSRGSKGQRREAGQKAAGCRAIGNHAEEEK